MLSAIPIVPVLIALFGSLVLSQGMRFLITEDRGKRGFAQLVFSAIVGFTMTNTPVGFLLVLFAPLWAALVLMVVVLVVMTLLGGLVIQPLVRAGYLGNYRKWVNDLRGDSEFQAALHLLDKEELVEIARMSADKDHFRNQVVEEANIPEQEAEA